jgi:xanthine/uracil permease
MMDRPREERSLGELFAELSKETSALVRHEVELARTEMTQKATRVGKDVGSLAVGGAVLYAGLLAIIAAIVLLLSIWIPSWLAALIVGLIIAGVGYMLVQRGMTALKQQDLAPRQTIDTLKEDTEWAKKQAS